MMSPEDSGPTELETIPLSRRQRRELVELVAAGVMSAAFFALPVVMVRDTFASKSVSPPPAAEASQAPRAVRATDLASVQVVTTDVAVPISSPELQAAAPAVVRAVRWSTPPRSRRPVAALSPRPSLGRRIARLFIGDGTHTVQPFPSVPATER